MGDLGLIGDHAAGEIWLCRCQLCFLWAGRARNRAGRLRLPLHELRAVLAGHVPDLCLWRREPAPEISAEAGIGEWVGCFGLTEPDAGSDPGGMITRAEKMAGRLPAERRQDVDLERADRRRVRGVGEIGRARRPDPRLHAGKGHEGPVRAEDRRQAVAALLDHRRDRDGRCGGARERAAAECLGLKGRSAA